MKYLAAFIATFVMLMIAGIIMSLARRAFFAATGANKPFQPKSDGDDPNRGLRFEGDGRPQELTRASFSGVTVENCPLHRQPYLGYSVMCLNRTTAMGSDEYTVGHLFILGCKSCFQEAQRVRALVWTRKNRKEHPAWASAQLYPHLVGGVSAQFAGSTEPKDVFIAFDDPSAIGLARQWIASPDPRVRAEGINALRFRKTDENIAIVRPLIHDTTTIGEGFLAVKFPVVSCAALDVLKGWGFDEKELVREKSQKAAAEKLTRT